MHKLTRQNDVFQLANLSGPFYLLGEGSNTVIVEDYIGTLVLNKMKVLHLKNQKFLLVIRRIW